MDAEKAYRDAFAGAPLFAPPWTWTEEQKAARAALIEKLRRRRPQRPYVPSRQPRVAPPRPEREIVGHWSRPE